MFQFQLFYFLSPRLKYMMDVLLAIKNNNVNKIPQYDPTLAEHLRKILRSLLVNGKYVTTLNITLEDLLRADQRGKWWVVGSAWSGNVNEIGGASSTKSSKGSQQAEATKFSATILELAKKQRMNTDDRRNVFCILMSAEVSVNILAFGRLIFRYVYFFRTIWKHLKNFIIYLLKIIKLL